MEFPVDFATTTLQMTGAFLTDLAPLLSVIIAVGAAGIIIRGRKRN
jgi:hypothetical protein